MLEMVKRNEKQREMTKYRTFSDKQITCKLIHGAYFLLRQKRLQLLQSFKSDDIFHLSLIAGQNRGTDRRRIGMKRDFCTFE